MTTPRFLVTLLMAAAAARAQLAVSTFQADVTPRLGTPLCFGLVDPGNRHVDPLHARGLILHGAGRPIVLAAVDYLGINNESHDEWRRAIAGAAGTTPDRVAVHTLHQHDAPGLDLTGEKALAPHGLGGSLYDLKEAEQALANVVKAVAAAAARKQPVTHIGRGRARVDRVASNRRIIGPDGRVKVTRMSSSRIPEAVAAPEGVVDPYVNSVSLWNGGKAVVSITYYATHPQSHYGKGGISWDFVGMARALRDQAAPGLFHLHFNGASGNVAAGKYNDGSPGRRPELAGRLAEGMKAAFEATERWPLEAKDVEWRIESATLPLRDTVREAELAAVIADPNAKRADRLRSARDIAWAQRSRRIDLTSLRLGSTHLIHFPGELFIEYQLAAKAMRGPGEVAVAAYGDLGPGYIGTAISYGQGGYETSVVSRTAPEVEGVLLEAARKLLR